MGDKMKVYQGNKDGDMSVSVKDYQPSKKEFAGVENGKANEYISRTEKRMDRDAGQVKKQAYKGRYG
jgi:hypothetical protein